MNSGYNQKRFQRKPEWLKIHLPRGQRYQQIRKIVREKNLHTVCQEASCPNLGECWSGGTATFMLMGDICTRGCKFCHVQTGKPVALDPREPDHIVFACREMNLDYVVLTSVNRDDLADQGALHLAKTISALRKAKPDMLVEILIPDFRGDEKALETVLDSQPHVVAHNVETVERLQKSIRDPRAHYAQSLFVLETIKKISPKTMTKSSLMLGVGEKPEELLTTFWDLRSRKVDILTLGQYLQPSPRHVPVSEFVTPERFSEYQKWGEKMGFSFVASGPLVRSSYRAGELFVKHVLHGNQKPSEEQDVA